MERKTPTLIGLEELKRHAESLFAFETATRQPPSGDAPKVQVSSLAALASQAAAPAAAEHPAISSLDSIAVPSAAEDDATAATARSAKVLSFRAPKPQKRD